MKVAVVTPTIGSEYLSQCINSVDKQTYSDLTEDIMISLSCVCNFETYTYSCEFFIILVTNSNNCLRIPMNS